MQRRIEESEEDYRKEKGFKFKPTFPSEIAFFEVRGHDKDRQKVLTTVHFKNGCVFDDEIEDEYFEATFDINEYVEITDDEL